MSAGVYILRCGESYYIGSSSDFRKRKWTHLTDLKRGVHGNAKIQAAYNLCGTAEFMGLEYLIQYRTENADGFRQRLRTLEQKYLNDHADSEWLCNKSLSAWGPDCREDTRKRWTDPAYREKMSALARGRRPSAATRRKMSAAKKGGKNSRAVAVLVTTPKGKEVRYGSVVEAAKFFKVSQQLMDQWLKGRTAWPGTGRMTRKQNQWIIGYTAKIETSIN